MTRAILALPVLLASCAERPPPPANRYVVASPASITVAFRPNAVGLTEPMAAALDRFALLVPARATPVVRASGPLAARRADAVALRIQHRVVVVRDDTLPPDTVGVSAASAEPVVATACLGPGGPLLDDNWTWNDENPARLLPPGCAVAANLAAQTTATPDLLYGRPLPPGAALPYAQAIERYDQRNAPGQPKEKEEGTASGSSSGSDQSAGSSGSGGLSPAQSTNSSAPGTAPANPLSGPLPGAQPAQ